MDDTLWTQLNIDYPFPDEDYAEHERQAAAHLNGILPTAEADGLITSWWFIRKGPWRVRYRLANPSSRPDIDPVHSLLTQAVSWTPDIYEPEVHAFGGPASMDLAHQLFHHDSRHLLPFLLHGAADRRERSLLLCAALMRAAGLDINEQGDVWAQVADHRTGIATPSVDPGIWNTFTGDIGQLLRGRPRTDAVDHDWAAAFDDTGCMLRKLRENGELTRGIRAIIALHVIFHWNRLGLSATTQALLARAAKESVFDSVTERAPC